MKKVLAFALVVVLSLSLVACGGSSSKLTDGSHEATVAGHNGDVTVVATVAGGKITEITLTNHEETEGLYQLAEMTVIPAIIEKQSTDVDIAAGATVTSDAIIKGVDQILAS